MFVLLESNKNVVIFQDKLSKGCVEVTPLEITAFSTFCPVYSYKIEWVNQNTILKATILNSNGLSVELRFYRRLAPVQMQSFLDKE